MAEILLINPPLTSKELYRRGAKATASIIPPLGLASIAAVLEEEGHSVEIIDGIAQNISFSDVVKNAECFEIVGITVLSAFFKRCAELIRAIKKVCKVQIIVGGAHATALPESLLEVGADYVVLGEGELTIKELVNAILTSSHPIENIQGISFKNGGKVIKTKRRPMIENINSLPLPARHLLPMHKYKTSEARANRNPSHSMIVSRGCPGACSFCCKILFGKKIRCRSPENIVEEMFLLKDKYNAKEIAFLDDTFTADFDIVSSVCKLLINNKFDIPWSCEARIDTVDREMLQMMKRAGCDFIAYGVESGSNEVLKSINKKITKKEIERTIRITQEIGIPIRGYFMLGFVGETERQMMDTINFAIKLNVDVASFSLLIPFPGTVDYIRASKEEGYFDPEFYKKVLVPEFNFPDYPIYSPKTVSPERLLTIHKKAYRKYYYRPKIILKEITNIRDFEGLKRIVKGGITLLKNYRKN